MKGTAIKISVSGSAQVILPHEGVGKAYELLEELKRRGVALTKELNGDLLLCIDHDPGALSKFKNSTVKDAKAVLLRLEPECVFPSQYKAGVEKLYQDVFSPGHRLQHKGRKYGWPYRLAGNPNQISSIEDKTISELDALVIADHGSYQAWKQRPISCSFIASNKVSPTRMSNYPLRRAIAKELSSELVSSYGQNWSDSFVQQIRYRLAMVWFNLKQGWIPNVNSVYGDLHVRFPHVRGTLTDKYEVLRNSRYTLVVENCNTYISEKLFDAIVSGCIPIYIGPKFDDLGIPEGMVLRPDASIEGIRELLASVEDRVLREVLNCGQKFISSFTFANNWTAQGVYRQIADEILVLA